VTDEGQREIEEFNKRRELSILTTLTTLAQSQVKHSKVTHNTKIQEKK